MMKKTILSLVIALVSYHTYAQSYLPLSGGTLTGPLYINSNFFAVQLSGTNIFASGSSAAVIGAGSQTDYINYIYGNNPYTVWTNGTQRFKVDGSGNIGIGTVSPQSILDVKGSPNFKGNVVLYGMENGGNSNTASPNLIFQGTDYAGATMISAPNETTYGRRGFTISTHSDPSDTRNLVERFRITYLGNVGIGTSNPDAKLTVSGTVHATEVLVDQSVPTPDYVFDKDYDLTTLKDVKTYIDQNHHLPEIPSAAQVAKEGINLGEMNAKLLKKIEELTLYLIEKDKQVNELQQEVSQIKQQLKTTAK